MVALNRRQLLAGVGASLLAAPFFRLLQPTSARAAGPAARRLIVFFSPNGTVHQHWRPQGEGSGFTFPAGSILEPLTAHREHLLVLGGLNFEQVRGGSHEGGMEHMLTGGGGPSIDQYIAAQLRATAPFQSIELGVQTSAWGAGVQTRMSYDDSHNYVHPEDDPLLAFGRLFGGVSQTPGDVDPKKLGRQSVIDLVRDELGALQGRLGNVEKTKLDAHLESLRRVEQRLSGLALSLGDCSAPAAPASLAKDDNATFPTVTELQMDLLVQAAACGLSPVLSLQCSHTVSPTICSWAGAGEGHHELSHKDDGNVAGVASFVDTERWFAEQFAALLDRLDALPEADGSGSLLDTSVVLWCKELGDARLHDFNSVPFVLAGGSDGYFNTGRYLELGGQPHQKLLVSLCQAMGLQQDHFGVDQITGPLSELTS